MHYFAAVLPGISGIVAFPETGCVIELQSRGYLDRNSEVPHRLISSSFFYIDDEKTWNLPGKSWLERDRRSVLPLYELRVDWVPVNDHRLACLKSNRNTRLRRKGLSMGIIAGVCRSEVVNLQEIVEVEKWGWHNMTGWLWHIDEGVVHLDAPAKLIIALTQSRLPVPFSRYYTSCDSSPFVNNCIRIEDIVNSRSRLYLIDICENLFQL